MLHKPWPLILMSIILFITPLFNIFLSYYLSNYQMGLMSFLSAVFFEPKNFSGTLSLVLPSWIAAFATYRIKNWSIPVFLVCMAWATGDFFIEIYSHFNLIQSFLIIALPIIFNGLFIFYFLIPAVKEVYINPRLRWWESKPRYIYTAPINLHLNEEEKLKGEIHNISEGGVFIKVPGLDKERFTFSASAEIEGIPFKLDVEVAHRVINQDKVGLKFINLKKQDQMLIKNICLKVKNSGAPETRVIPPWQEDLKQWIKTLKTGKGFIPDTKRTN
jgi:hypothetical protein